jgi:mono/diheme cytochrome c family protein
MIKRYRQRCLMLTVIGLFLGTVVISSLAQPTSGQRPSGDGSSMSPPTHGEHQTPEGWKFSWPPGDPVNGREVFVKLECYSCHAVNGEQFPAPVGDIGPELSMMGPMHDAEYFAEAIINPNAVIDRGKGYEAVDGTSKMPSYNNLLTVQEVIDLVAYLKGLKPPFEAPAGHSSGSKTTNGHGRHGTGH